MDHSGGDVSDDFAVSVTDALGDTGTGTLSMAVWTMRRWRWTTRTASARTTPAPVTGNVVTGNDTLGADETPSPVTGVVAGTGTPAGNVGAGVAGIYGTLTIDTPMAATATCSIPPIRRCRACRRARR